jgi:hypothetical protein
MLKISSDDMYFSTAIVNASAIVSEINGTYSVAPALLINSLQHSFISTGIQNHDTFDCWIRTCPCSYTLSAIICYNYIAFAGGS